MLLLIENYVLCLNVEMSYGSIRRISQMNLIHSRHIAVHPFTRAIEVAFLWHYVVYGLNNGCLLISSAQFITMSSIDLNIFPVFYM